MPASDETPSLDVIASAFSRACRLADVPHAFVGGLAVAAWGRPRLTADVDVLVCLRREQAAGLVQHLLAEGLEVETEVLAAAFDDRAHVTVFSANPGIHIDMALVHDAARTEQIAVAIEVPLPAGPVPVARPEDTVAYKVLYGTEQDVEDARSILARRFEALDRERLGEIAARVGVGDQVAALLREVEEHLGT